MTPGPLIRTYSKRQIRRSWRFFRFWTYWFNMRIPRAALALLLSDDAFGRIAKLVKRQPSTTEATRRLDPFVQEWAPGTATTWVNEGVHILYLPSELDDGANEQLTMAINNSDATWTFVATSGADANLVEGAVTTALSLGEDFDLLYTDELYVDEPLPRSRPSRIGPHTLLSGNVIGRHYLIRNSSARAVGGVRSEFGSASEFDLFLRMMDEGNRFSRYPYLVTTPRPTYRQTELLAATTAALARRELPSLRTESESAGLVNWHVYSVEPASVEILIPTRDRLDLLQRCIEQVERITTYKHFSITILNNDSAEPATLEYLATTKHKVVNCPGDFNYARIINQGAITSNAEFLVMLNNDTIVKTSNWLELLLGAALLDDVGVVGAKIIDQHNEVEHSGIALAPYPQHIRFGVNIPDSWTEFSGIRDVCAVTGAVHMIARSKWVELGGMDEDLAVLLNDVDLCMRAELKGWHTVLQPAVVVQHFVSSSRGRLNPTADRERFIEHWGIFRDFTDPYFPEVCSLYANRLVFNAPPSQLFRWSRVLRALSQVR